MKSYYLIKELPQGFVGDRYEADDSGHVTVGENIYKAWLLKDWFEEIVPKPAPEVGINIYKNHEWYGNRVAIKFPSRNGHVWITLEEYTLLKDAIATEVSKHIESVANTKPEGES